MKFLIITNHSYMLWQFRRELIEALLQRGEVVIGTPFVGHEKDFEELGCRCVETKLERRGKNLLQEAALFERYRKLLQREKPDLVITYSIKPNIYAGLLCQRMKIPYCCNVQGLGTAFQSQKSAAAASVLYRAGLKKAKTTGKQDHGAFRRGNQPGAFSCAAVSFGRTGHSFLIPWPYNAGEGDG